MENANEVSPTYTLEQSMCRGKLKMENGKLIKKFTKINFKELKEKQIPCFVFVSY